MLFTLINNFKTKGIMKKKVIAKIGFLNQVLLEVEDTQILGTDSIQRI